MFDKTISMTIDGTDYVAVPAATWRKVTGQDFAPAKGLAGRDAVAFMAASLGRDLRQLRVAAGLTQVELAARLGVTQGNVANVEAGRARVGAAALKRWEKVCAG